MLICKNLNKSYSDGNNSIDILSNINLNISSGETVAITGASGSGKSTLLHILSTLDNADSGEINLDGHLISGLDDNKLSKIRLTKIGFIYQFHHLIKELSVKENISLPLYIAKKSNTDIEKIVNEASSLLHDSDRYKKMSMLHNPYGDGKASERIVKFLLEK